MLCRNCSFIVSLLLFVTVVATTVQGFTGKADIIRLQTRLFDSITLSATATPNDEPHSTVTVAATLGKPICIYKTITIQPTGVNKNVQPQQAVSVEDLTPHIKSFLSSSDMHSGTVTVISRHTTTAITINEREHRLEQDVARYFLSICPPDERSSSKHRVTGTRYLHNDIDQRPDGADETQRCRENGFRVDDPEELRKWRSQEPINAHSHLISMMLGSSECIPVVNGEMVIGQWQSVLLVDLDGPRRRTVGVQLMGFH